VLLYRINTTGMTNLRTVSGKLYAPAALPPNNNSGMYLNRRRMSST